MILSQNRFADLRFMHQREPAHNSLAARRAPWPSAFNFAPGLVQAIMAPSTSLRDYGSLVTELPRGDMANSRFIGGAHAVGGRRTSIDRLLVI
jgi:hypothetical protein